MFLDRLNAIARDRQGLRRGRIRTGDPRVGRRLDTWHGVVSHATGWAILCLLPGSSGPSTGMPFASRSPDQSACRPASHSCSALPQFPATLANDGRTRDTGAFWATDVSRQRSWWQVDLEDHAISRVVIVSYYGDDATTVSRSRHRWTGSPGKWSRPARQQAAVHAGLHVQFDRAARLCVRCPTTRPTRAATWSRSWCTN